MSQYLIERTDQRPVIEVLTASSVEWRLEPGARSKVPDLNDPVCVKYHTSAERSGSLTIRVIRAEWSRQYGN